MRWSLSNSISVIPGALALTTVKVTGPAGTLEVSSAQPSFPPLLAIVTLTALVPPGCPGFAGLELLFEWPQAVSINVVTATKAIAVGQHSRDRHLARTVRFAVNRFPLVFGPRLAAHRDYGAKAAGQRKGGQSPQKPHFPQLRL